MSDVLVVNCGSSSVKAAVVDPSTGRLSSNALAERLNGAGAELVFDGERERLPAGAGHAEALTTIFARLGRASFAAVGHRVVHGGEAFADSIVLDDEAIDRIRACVDLAPLHNPSNLLGIEAARQRYAETPQVAVFDTAFHQTLPSRAYLYAIPYELYQRFKIRRYGFHGSSHRYVASEAARRLGRSPAELELVTAHLGNGCSACAVKSGKSVDTTMGLTPLEGLVMGTRSGDVDPNLHQFLRDHAGKDLAQVTELLNRQSGLLGLSGTSNDMRTLLAARDTGDPQARLAVDVFCYRLAKALLGLCAALGRLDALVFTGGIGEHAAPVRAETLAQLAVLGVVLDPERNRDHGARTGGLISAEDSRVPALVVKTNEELVIAREAARLTTASEHPE